MTNAKKWQISKINDMNIETVIKISVHRVKNDPWLLKCDMLNAINSNVFELFFNQPILSRVTSKYRVVLGAMPASGHPFLP